MNKEILNLNKISFSEPNELVLEDFDLINIREQSLNLICARPGNGKSQMLLNIMQKISNVKDEVLGQKKYQSLFVSLEMSKEDLARRLKHIDKDWFENDILKNKSNIAILESMQINLLDIKMSIINWERTNNTKLNFVFIDYIQLLQDEPEKVAIDLVEIAKELDVIIFSAAQLLPGFCLDKMEKATDFVKKSSKYVDTATTMIVCQKGKNKNELWVDVAKNRHATSTLDHSIKSEFQLGGKINVTSGLNTATNFSMDDLRLCEAAGCLMSRSLGYANYTWNKLGEDKTINLIDFEPSMKDIEQLIVNCAYELGSIIIHKRSVPKLIEQVDVRLEQYYGYIYLAETGKDISSMSPDEYNNYEKQKNKFLVKIRKGLTGMINDYTMQIKEIAKKIGTPCEDLFGATVSWEPNQENVTELLGTCKLLLNNDLYSIVTGTKVRE